MNALRCYGTTALVRWMTVNAGDEDWDAKTRLRVALGSETTKKAKIPAVCVATDSI